MVCPVCGGNHFKSGQSYSMIDMGKLLDAFKGRRTSGGEYKVTHYECQECGYVFFRKRNH